MELFAPFKIAVLCSMAEGDNVSIVGTSAKICNRGEYSDNDNRPEGSNSLQLTKISLDVSGVLSRCHYREFCALTSGQKLHKNQRDCRLVEPGNISGVFKNQGEKHRGSDVLLSLEQLPLDNFTLELSDYLVALLLER